MLFENHEVEIIEVNGQVLFNPRHVGACLEMAESTIKEHIASMSDKQVIKLTNSADGLTDCRKFNNMGENFLTESGVYKLVFKSRKPEAEKFTDWVTDTVLPAIRKTGEYKAPIKKEDTPLDIAPKTAKAFKAYMQIGKMIGLEKNIAAISANQACIALGGVNPLAIMGQLHLEAEVQELFFTPTDLGKRMNLSAQGFNSWIAKKGLQDRINNIWIPTSKGKEFCKIFDAGKKHGSGTSVQQIKWNEKTLEL